MNKNVLQNSFLEIKNRSDFKLVLTFFLLLDKCRMDAMFFLYLIEFNTKLWTQIFINHFEYELKKKIQSHQIG